MSAGIVPVEQSHTYDNGWTVKIKQVLMDRNSIATLVELTARRNRSGLGTVYSIWAPITNAQGEELAGRHAREFRWKTRTRRTIRRPSCGGMMFCWGWRGVGRELHADPSPVLLEKKEGPVQFSDGWSCTGTLPTEDAGLLYQMDGPSPWRKKSWD